MKKLIFLLMLGIASVSTKAQINVNINIGSQPLWGPTGYDYAQYYYLPDIESYYYVPKHQFVYLDGGRWIFSANLPARYNNYDLYNGYKVVINRDRPYLNFNDDRVKYVKYKNWGGRQMVIRNSDDKRYYVVKGHPHGMPPGQAKKMYGKGNGNNGHGKGHDKDKH
ncbi:hypothetical protein VRU48_02680 [Pedobacter sp. KR3-3]|uniref:WG repeat-containing protein n=1 Tax=Pedobacter albus TaxID=3113905 RepID=A0ABU7I3F2_9SPHI|nr:hypothetical protein [Pedobacter sp. KR3-3]MEE1943997.1 hypothetical protein [Pedobacter sp. KR3-3]